jgi:hypothetical protein
VRKIVRHSILIALLAGAAVRPAPAQVTGAPPDSARATRTAPAPDTLKPASLSVAGFRNDVLPVIEITGMLALFNVSARIIYPNETQDGIKVYSSTISSTWNHLRTQHWVYDIDPFNTNQFAHPYQGATMYGLSRSSGHGFWTSLVLSDVGSFVWKMAGETDPPSINDMITTGQAGSMLGEALYRMADLVLKDSGDSKPDAKHEWAATLISPPGGLNRWIFGERFKAKLPDTAPATIWQLRFGATLDALARDLSTPTSILFHRDATAEFAMSYGVPGQPGYEYTRPLDYFDFQGTFFLSNFSNFVENIMIRGLLVGSKTAGSDNSKGIWGLYGSFDYISPQLFRVSSTALSLGTTRQYFLTPDLSLQGSLLGGVGYGAAGSTTIIASTPTNAAIRDYHFGITPQVLAAARLILGDRAMIDVAARDYYVSGTGSDDKQGSERIFRGSAGVTVHIHGPHAVGVQYVISARDGKYGNQPEKQVQEGAFTFVYSILGGNRFTAVK